MRRLASALVLLVSLSAAAAPPHAAVVVAADGGLDAETLVTLRTLAVTRLRERGVSAADEPALEGARKLDDALASQAAALGIDRLFALRMGKLGQKMLFTLDEVSVNGLAPLSSAHLTAATLEEAEKIVPRLVDSVVDRKPIAETARFETVTAIEAADVQKRSGEFLLSAGLPLNLSGGSANGAFGLSLALSYETPHARLDAMLLGSGASSHSYAWAVGFQGNYLFMDGEWTPYLGGGVGFVGTGNDTYQGSGAGLLAEVGVEALRLHRARVMVGVQALLPLYQATHTDYSNNSDTPVTSSSWTPGVLLHLRLAL